MKDPYHAAKKAYNSISQIYDIQSKLEAIIAALNKLNTDYNDLLSKYNHLMTNFDQLVSKHDYLISKCEETNNVALYNQNILQSNTEISAIPQSTGDIRLIQKGNVKMLELLKTICKKYRFEFILWGGSLLGAIRHNDFIPWDDDVDVVMPREQFNQMFSIMDDLFKGTKLFYVHSEIIRIYYGNTPLQIDIFPLDFYPKKLENLDEKKQLSDLLHETCAKNINFNWDKLFQQKRVIQNLSYKQIEKLRRTKICPDVAKKDAAKIKSTVMRGFEVNANPNRFLNVFDYDWIYPIKEHKFMNTTMPIVSQPDTVLSLYYGDYQAWPPALHAHSDISSRYNFLSVQEVKNIVSGKTNLLDKVN